MNLTIELSDDKAEALKAQAAARGLTVERWVGHWVEQWVEQIAEQHVEAQPASIAHLQETNPKEWGRLFHEWAESHDRTKPPLSDEAISRESIYPDRG
jgi:hypothetical protein